MQQACRFDPALRPNGFPLRHTDYRKGLHMSGRLQGKVAIVTGAGCVGPGWGNGRAMAVRFAEEGARVLAADRDPERLAETLERAAQFGSDDARPSVRRHR